LEIKESDYDYLLSPGSDSATLSTNGFGFASAIITVINITANAENLT
jgi:hypothetical protein